MKRQVFPNAAKLYAPITIFTPRYTFTATKPRPPPPPPTNNFNFNLSLINVIHRLFSKVKFWPTLANDNGVKLMTKKTRHLGYLFGNVMSSVNLVTLVKTILKSKLSFFIIN